MKFFFGRAGSERTESVYFLLKFATMLKDRSNLGSGDITVENDPRVLPVGRVLRKTKINEVPHVLNVLMGTMSLVDPKPLTEETFRSIRHGIKISSL